MDVLISERDGRPLAARRLLVVDGDPAVARDLETRLTRFGYDIAATATSGREAIELTARLEPHLVLMDLSLAGEISGIAAAAAIRERRAVPVIFTTADPNGAALAPAHVTEPYGYVTKPFNERELRVNLELALCKFDLTRQAHELEERFFAVSIDLLCMLDFSGYFTRLNPAWERTLDFTREELMARPFIEFVHPDDRERTLHKNAEVRSGGHALGFENRYRCKDGSYRWLLWNASPDAGKHTIYSVARDITARKQAEAEREELVRKLQAALAEVRTLQAILPICSYCKMVRNDENYWLTVEMYLAQHTTTQLTHGVCPDCYETKVVPQLKALGCE